MDPIKYITVEHGPIQLMLKILGKMNEKIANQEPIEKKDLDDGIIFIREFADACHHGKEETLLFPAMKKNNIKKEVELIDILIEEHKQGRGYVKNLVEAIAKIKSDPTAFRQLFADNSQKYIALLSQHIEKENKILFQEAKSSLSESAIKELAEGFTDVEENKIGLSRIKELHDMVNKLKEAYL